MKVSHQWDNTQRKLEQQALTKHKPKIFERYQTKHSLQEHEDKLDKFSTGRGV